MVKASFSSLNFYWLWTFCLTLICIVVALDPPQESSGSISEYMSSHDRLKLKTYFKQNVAEALEPNKAYYIVKGLMAVGDVPPSASLCSTFNVPLLTPELAFYHASGLKMLSSSDCKISVKEIKDLAAKRLNEHLHVEDLFYTVMAMKDADISVDSSTVAKFIVKLTAKDSSPTTMALVSQIVSHLNLSKAELLPYVNIMSGILDFADELNGHQLFFEKGLYTTALVAQGISDLITAYGDPSIVPEQKLVKLINFVGARLHSNNLRAAAYLAAALNSLAKNPFLAPVLIESQMSVATAGEVYRDQPDIQLRLKNLWGDSYNATVNLKAGGLYAVHRTSGDRTRIGPSERGKFAVDSSFVYRLSLTEPNNPPVFSSPGRYELDVSADWIKPDRKKLLGVTHVKLPVRVLSEAKVIEPLLTLMDSSSDHHLSDISLTYGQLYKGGPINLEIHHQMSITLRLVDANDLSVPLTAHQMFLQLTHQQTQQAITFLFSELDATGVNNAKAYRVRLNPEQSAADFDYLDGVYKMELIMGDPFLRNPSIWHMIDVQLHFGGEPGADSAQRVTQATDISQQRSPSPAAMKRASGPNSLIGTGPTKAKPEIAHTFRVPEKRAPRFLAWAFTIACAVPPIILLFVWAIIGVNVWNFRFGLSNLFFHMGLIAIFCLYLLYWLRLNMFTTLGYLAILGVPTFLCGNSVLRAHLSSRMAATIAATHTRK